MCCDLLFCKFPIILKVFINKNSFYFQETNSSIILFSTVKPSSVGINLL